ncbi:MAG: SMP-30/gluconolactonase/LRE family protein [Lewinella sp.]
MFRFFLLTTTCFLFSCGQSSPSAVSSPEAPQVASEVSETAPEKAPDPPLSLAVEYLVEAPAKALLGEEPEFEVLHKGMEWSEGPLVLPDGRVLCSDVPRNHILVHDKGETNVYLDNSGSAPDDYSSEPGSNGLHLDENDKLVLCQHGARRVVRMEAPLDAPAEAFTVLADNYRGKRFNSPNDLVIAKDGSILFTDPIYGLPGREKSTLKELDYCGVFRIDPTGSVHLLSKQYLRPNGIGLSPDNKTLYVADSDRSRLTLTATPILDDTFALGEPVYLIKADHLARKVKGSTDGLAVGKNGRIFATAPGGVWILEPDGTVIAKISTGLPVSNVELAPDEDLLYMTSDYYLICIKLS